MGDNIIELLNNKNILANEYDVYEKLYNYWEQTMRDDCYIIKNVGWTIELNTSTKNKKQIKHCAKIFLISIVICKKIKMI